MRLSITTTVQMWNGGGYVNTGTSWSASGTGAAEISQNTKLSPGQYRTITSVAVYSAQGAYIETVTQYSNSIVI